MLETGRTRSEGAASLAIPVTIVVTVIALLVAVRSRSLILQVMVPMSLFALMLVGRPRLIVILFFLLAAAGLQIPGLPAILSPFNLASFLVIAWGIASMAMKEGHRAMTASQRTMLLFIGLVVLTMSIRGFSFRLLGGGEYGGSLYILLLMNCALYLMIPRVEVTESDLKKIVLIQLIFGSLPALMQAAHILTGGQVPFVRYFAGATSYVGSTVQEGAAGSARWAALRFTSLYLLAFALVWPFRPRYRKLRGVLVVASFLMMALTGFRNFMFMLAGILFLYAVLKAKHRFPTMLRGAAVGVILIVGVGLAAPLLPRNMQRAVSFIPFADVDPGVAYRARQAWEWRFDIWRVALEEAHNYVVIGRGLVVDVMPWAWLTRGAYGAPEFLYFMGSYHSGPISLYIDFGGLGLLIGTVFFVLVCVEALKDVKRFEAQPRDFLWHMHLFYSAAVVYQALSFYVFYGDLKTNFQRFLLWSILRLLASRALNRRMSHDAAAPVPQPDVNLHLSMLPARGL